MAIAAAREGFRSQGMRFLDFGYSATVMLGMFVLLLLFSGVVLALQRRLNSRRELT